MRQISTEGLEIAGQGISGDVYRYGSDRVIKVFHDTFTEEQVERAFTVGKFVYDNGIPTAEPYEVIRSGNCYGLIAEYVGYPTLLSQIAEGSVSRQDGALGMGPILRKVHDLKPIPGIQTEHEMVAGILDRCRSILKDDEISELMEHIDRFPGKDYVIHGDFHEKNILVRGDKDFLLIDLDSVCVGSPLFEMLQMFCIYKTGIPKKLRVTPEEGCLFLRTILEIYFDTKDDELLSTYEDIFTDVSWFSVMFSKILRMQKGEEEQIRKEIQQDLPLLMEAFGRAESKYGLLPWR